MKKLLLILLLIIPLTGFAQRVYTDTLTVETDTIIKFRIFDPNFLVGWYAYADTLEGTLDGTVEFVVADDLSENGYPSDPATIADSLFVLYNPGLRDTLDAVGPYGFKFNSVPFDYGGIKFTVNNTTKWFIPYKLITKSQNQ